MPQEKNTFLRILVPVLLLAGGVALFWAVKSSSQTQQPKSNPPAAAGSQAQSPAQPSSNPASPPSAPASQPAAQPQPGAPGLSAPAGPTGLSARVLPADTSQTFAPIGSLTPAKQGGTHRFEVKFTPFGAGVDSITLADYFQHVEPGSPHQVVQETVRSSYTVYAGGTPTGTTVSRVLVPYALLGLTINGTFVPTTGDRGPVWQERQPGEFESYIVDDAGAPVARIVRRFSLAPASHDLELEQTLENLTDHVLAVSWLQMGPVDLPASASYGGDMRRVRIGYLSSPAVDPEQQVVVADTRLFFEHPTAVGEPYWDERLGSWSWGEKNFWPDSKAVADGLTPAWVASTDRYFASAVHPIPSKAPARADTPSKSAPDKRLQLLGDLDRLALTIATTDRSEAIAKARLGLRISGPVHNVAAGGKQTGTLGIYAGPISQRVTRAEPGLDQMGLGELVLYYYGGPCGWCTFQPIARILHVYLGFLHDYLVRDWALAIILMVLTVRTLLHPVTKWSQMSMIRFGKQMGALAPKQAKIKEKYGDDPVKMREEIGKLMREENISYAGLLGCLPAFLQTPIWIGVYAMISFNFELRHHPAFFGVFQWLGSMTGKFWPFLADLSDQDRFIPIPAIEIPLIGWTFDSINVLPVLLGVVFFIQQKYLTPPPTAQLTPEQEQQQKIMKIMMVVLFPVMMYKAPAALSLYFIANSTFGSLEGRYIRRHYNELEAQRQRREAEGPLPGGKNLPKPKGFMDRLKDRIAEAQKVQQDRKKRKGRDR